MALLRFITFVTICTITNASVLRNTSSDMEQKRDGWREVEKNLTNVFNGVYTECFLHLSYSCVQRKTLLYLYELNKLKEVSVIGDYVKFVKVNTSEPDEISVERNEEANTEELSFMIDDAVDKFFHNHVMKFNGLGKDIAVPNKVDEFVGRKRRKGGGGGHGGHGGDDGGKKKMMMMAMMCMKMKLMMMVPAMMGMMGMMSFKGMMFSMMSFMMAKMMLLMKLLEKKGGGGGLGGGSDASWPAAVGGGGAWMPAGGDYGGGTGGYDANGQWQSRSIIERRELDAIHSKPVISYVTPYLRYNNKETKALQDIQKEGNKEILRKSRKKRGVVDALQYIYTYWFHRLIGHSVNRRKLKLPYYKYVNGIKYVYQPMKTMQKTKQLNDLQNNDHKSANFRPILVAEDFNKGEIIEGAVESRMNRKKLKKIKNSVNDTLDDNPWQ